MKKKIIVISIVAVLLVLGVLLYVKYSPVWVSVSTLVGGVIGLVCGWVSHVLYAKYVK